MKWFVRSYFPVFILIVGWPFPALSTVGWETGDMVLDFGLKVESGESTILVDKSEVGDSFFAELTWNMNPDNCLLQTREAGDGSEVSPPKNIMDDGLFHGAPFHAVVASTDELLVMAQEGKTCEIDAANNDFLVVARAPRGPGSSEHFPVDGPLGAVVMVFRATSFFTPHEVTVKPGQKVVWIYADGAQEPHSVTSGGCRVNDCTGGGQQFQSGPTLHKPGHRFEHVFKHPGTFPYHCDLHLGSMQGVITVK